MDALARARTLIDAAHTADPARAADGRAAELVYADRMEAWIARLVPDGSPLLRLAARCQHLERFRVPRASFPDGRAGYLAWRKSLYTKQAERARALLLEADVGANEAAEVATWVSKTGLKSNPGTIQIVQQNNPVRVNGNSMVVPEGQDSFKAMLDVAIQEELNNGFINNLVQKYQTSPNSFYSIAKPFSLPQ